MTCDHKALAAGVHATAEYYPSLGEERFGHSGVGGRQALADPRDEIALAYVRRRLALHSVAVEDIGKLIDSLVKAIEGR